MLVAVLAVAACSDNRVYDKYMNTPTSGWEKNDTLYFGVPKLSAGGMYESSLMLRINQGYPFMSLTLIVQQTVLPSREVFTDTLKCRLIDDKGRTTGKGLNYYQYTFPISRRTMAEGDSLHVTIRHDMKREILPGISDVGLMLSRVR